jgi:hypothetical protein
LSRGFADRVVMRTSEEDDTQSHMPGCLFKRSPSLRLDEVGSSSSWGSGLLRMHLWRNSRLYHYSLVKFSARGLLEEISGYYGTVWRQSARLQFIYIHLHRAVLVYKAYKRTVYLPCIFGTPPLLLRPNKQLIAPTCRNDHRSV